MVQFSFSLHNRGGNGSLSLNRLEMASLFYFEPRLEESRGLRIELTWKLK
jgi:hypothetical protein